MKNYLHKLLRVFPVLAFRLSGNKISKTILLYMQILYTSIIWKLGSRKLTKFFFEFGGKKFSITLRDSTDIAALEEIYIDGEYNWNLPYIPKTILDLGANYGDTALYYHTLYPDAIIYAVEASDESYKRLCEHVKDIPEIVPVHAAVADFDGMTDLYLMEESSLGHSLVQRSGEMKKVSVPALTLASLARKYNQDEKFDLVKFDIEGAEEKMFLNVQPEQYSKAYTGEVHYDLMGLSQEDIANLFTEFTLHTVSLSNKDRVIIRAIYK